MLEKRHHTAIILLAKKPLTKNELRMGAKYNPYTLREVVETLERENLILPLKHERGEGLRLSDRGKEMAAQLLVLSLT